jgi:hypothetical protein
MRCSNAAKVHRKSGVAKWRDLQFSGSILEMFQRSDTGRKARDRTGLIDRSTPEEQSYKPHFPPKLPRIVSPRWHN